jgi:hypothetical protein
MNFPGRAYCDTEYFECPFIYHPIRNFQDVCNLLDTSGRRRFRRFQLVDSISSYFGTKSTVRCLCEKTAVGRPNSSVELLHSILE